MEETQSRTSMPRVGIRVTTSSSLKKLKIHPAIILASADEIGDYSADNDNRWVRSVLRETETLRWFNGGSGGR